MHNRVCRASLRLTLRPHRAQGGGTRQARDCAANVFSALQHVDYSVRRRPADYVGRACGGVR